MGMGTELYLDKGEKSLPEGETENMHSSTLYIITLNAIFIYLSIVASRGRWRQLFALHTIICLHAEKEQVEEITTVMCRKSSIWGRQ